MTISMPLSSQTIVTAKTIQSADIAMTIQDSREKTYRLSVSFFSGLENLIETVDFILTPSSTLSRSDTKQFAQDILMRGAHGVVDIYPLNGTIRKNWTMKDFIRPKHRQEIQTHARLLEQIDPKGKFVRCLVLDFKDSQLSYRHFEEIAATEKAFAAFFKGSCPRRETDRAIYQLIHEHRIHYFINEGSLKAKLVSKTFTLQQSNFLQETEQGRDLLCELCEYIMNGFKMGYEVTAKTVCYHPNDYLAAIRSHAFKESAHEIKLTPTLKMLTFYPQAYQAQYGEKSHYFELISNLFKTEHYYEEQNETTIISIQ